MTEEQEKTDESSAYFYDREGKKAHFPRKITEKERREIYIDFLQNMSMNDLMRKYKRYHPTIRKIIMEEDLKQLEKKRDGVWDIEYLRVLGFMKFENALQKGEQWAIKMVITDEIKDLTQKSRKNKEIPDMDENMADAFGTEKNGK